MPCFDELAQTRYLGFDPGSHKCGLAVLDEACHILFRGVVPTAEALDQVHQLCAQFDVQLLILGNQTGSQTWRKLFQEQLPRLALALIDERYSSQQARLRYWEFYPAGWQVFLPITLRKPPQPYDDLVAVILVERYVQEQIRLGKHNQKQT